MIDCDFCGAVTRVIDNRCLSCGRSTLADWPDERGNVRQICVTRRDKAGQNRSGVANK